MTTILTDKAMKEADFYEAGLKKWDELYPGLNPAVWDDARIEYANAFKAGAEYARTLRTDIKEEIVASLRNKLTPFFNLAAIVIDTDEGVSIDYLKSYADSCNPNEVKELLQQAAQQCVIKDEREGDQDLWDELGNEINKIIPHEDAFGVHPALDILKKKYTLARK